MKSFRKLFQIKRNFLYRCTMKFIVFNWSRDSLSPWHSGEVLVKSCMWFVSNGGEMSRNGLSFQTESGNKEFISSVRTFPQVQTATDCPDAPTQSQSQGPNKQSVRTVGFCRFSVTSLSPDESINRPGFPSRTSCFYLRGWGRHCRGKEEEGLEEGERGDIEAREAREAVAAASSASSSSPAAPWSSWLTLDCKAAGVSHSLGRQLCRNGTQELK